MGYATAISDKVGLIDDPVMERDAAIIAFMLSIAAIIVLACKVSTNDILSASTFKSGMSASICVLGVAWLGTTFVNAHVDEITEQEARAVQAVAALQRMSAVTASVLRDGVEQRIPVAALVPGDVTHLAEGDAGSADGRLAVAARRNPNQLYDSGKVAVVHRTTGPMNVVVLGDG